MFFDRLLKRKRWSATPLPGRARRSAEVAGSAVDDGFLESLRQLSLASRPRMTGGHTGEHASPRRANALEFADYRNYSPGDDFRRVDWNAYLRLEQLLVKLADAPERLDLHLLLDCSRSMASGQPDKFGYARRLAAGLSYIALTHLDRVSLAVLRGSEWLRLTRQESPAATAGMVQALNSLQPEGDTNLDSTLSGYMAAGNHRGVAVLISDLLSPGGYQQGLERLSRTGLRPVVIHILSPQELRPVIEGDLELQDVETGDTLQVSVDWSTFSATRAGCRSGCGRSSPSAPAGGSAT
jgi:uncharacterized protein (DUF58 family)